MRSKAGWVGTGFIAALAASAAAGAPQAAGGAEPVLGARGVAALAKRTAKQWGDSRPRDIRYATGTLEDVLGLIEPGAKPQPGGQIGGAQSEVDLIAVWGRFTADVSTPRGAKPPTGSVLELIVDARTGFAERRALTARLRVPLSHLGRVIDLGHGDSSSPPHRR